MPMPLTDDQKRFYRENGFLRLDAVTPSGEIERLRGIIEALMASRVGVERGDRLDVVGNDDPGGMERSPQLLMPCNYAPELIGRLHRDALGIAAQLLDGEVFREGEHVIMKPAGIGPPTPLHQDEAFWSPKVDYTSLSIWFPLADVDDRNGCMVFVPGSHLEGIRAHRSIGNDPTNNGLEVCESPTFKTVAVPLPAGGATVHHCRTIHGTTGNSCPHARYAYILGFGLRPAPAAVGRDYYWQNGRRLRREILAEAGGYSLTKMHLEL